MEATSERLARSRQERQTRLFWDQPLASDVAAAQVRMPKLTYDAHVAQLAAKAMLHTAGPHSTEADLPEWVQKSLQDAVA